ncbi:MAG TPA: hypothetical protein VFE32_23045 [Puia sp.]|jgi:hypothetical protein|nr:hypothetical protein [Puia sp.]
MLNRALFLAIAFCLLVSVACKKSNHSGNSGPNPLEGSWTFEGETSNADITSTATFGPIAVKVVNLLDFRTIDNMGSLTFMSDSLNAVGVGYTIDTTYTTYTYTGITTDTTVSPLSATVQPTNTSVSYKLIGQDSIYFPNGSPFALNVDSIQPPIQINGAHFTISGNTLTFTSTLNQSGNETINGITAPTTGTISSVITLSKQ